MPYEAVEKLEKYANTHEQTQGQFTIADEKVCVLHGESPAFENLLADTCLQEHNVFMRVTDNTVQLATGEQEPVAVMAKLREMKNNFK